MGASVQMGSNAKLYIEEGKSEVFELWLDADIQHPNVPNPSLLCLGAKESLNWIASSIAAYHHIRFSPVE